MEIAASRCTMPWSARPSRPDKAKAVVQAMEKEMFSELATKQDLQNLKQELTLLLTLRMGGMLAAGFTIMMALLKLML